MNNKDMRHFNTAKDIAKISDSTKAKIGCVLVYKNKVIGTGFNCQKTHPLQKMYNIYRFENDDKPHSLHAEIHALLPLIKRENEQSFDWANVKLYTYRNRKIKGKQCLGLSRPCPSCLALIKKLGIKNLYYTTNDGYCYEELK